MASPSRHLASSQHTTRKDTTASIMTERRPGRRPVSQMGKSCNLTQVRIHSQHAPRHRSPSRSLALSPLLPARWHPQLDRVQEDTINEPRVLRCLIYSTPSTALYRTPSAQPRLDRARESGPKEVTCFTNDSGFEGALVFLMLEENPALDFDTPSSYTKPCCSQSVRNHV